MSWMQSQYLLVKREAVAACDIWKAQRRAMQLSYANLSCEKANLACERSPDKHLLEAEGILKRSEMEDKYLVYKTNSSQYNDDSDYVLKLAVQWHR